MIYAFFIIASQM